MFTQNQVRQFYVANGYQDAPSGLTNAGDICVGSQNGDVYFNYANADGEIMRTDTIDKNKIMSVTFTPADKQKYVSKATLIKLSDDAIDKGIGGNGTNPYAGEDYMLNIKFDRMDWNSDQAPGWKWGVAHTTTSTTTSDFYKILAKSLVANMSRDPQKLLKVYTVDASGATTANMWNSTDNYTEITKASDVPTGDVYGVVVDEAEQPWILGKMEQEPVYYGAYSGNIYVGGQDVKWGVETEFAGNTIIQNGKKIADMEWFYHGERGDIYREAAWPNNWPNEMLANKNSKYDTIDIHYYWNGANHAVQKSEKDITIACPVNNGDASGQVAYNIISDLKKDVAALSNLSYSSDTVSTVILG